MKKRFGGWILACWMMVACTPASPPADPGGEEKQPMTEEQAGEEVETKVKHLRVPWSLVATDRFFYISERGGAIVEVPRSGGEPSRSELRLSKPVHHKGEGGFLGLALHPDRKSQDWLFAYHTYRDQGETKNRVILLEKKKGVWTEKKALLEDIPGGFIHNGGRLGIGPDGKLYITTGDAGRENMAQNLKSLAGKILRINPDGTIPTDNPFKGSPVYSYGHRNPQGLAWTDNGRMYSSEHGPSGSESGRDEINRIQAGKNYGWPVIKGDQKKKGMVSPLYQSGKDTWAPSGMAYLDGKLYVAGLRGEQVRSFSIQEKQTRLVDSGKGRLRDLVEVEGALYVLTNNTDGRGTPKKGDDLLLKLSP
ncbi:glucose/arabinose dehydrogenase [Melghirimyces profundicolus]|uniref:Glucose/arabinose dehydrogenase n=1 Tax=Melghirimyces profundicolus TaxID=1242148 RepID=A0A2T6BCA6_9BACL|nr:PQQ-dependent sugar dehydrogenase [Melghirimyces profundicolus]PTX53708.1 glucose/arabinose dehydrogenase [Melghirimyces profundicolus]